MTVLDDFNKQYGELKNRNVGELEALIEAPKKQQVSSLERGIAALILNRKEAVFISILELLKKDKVEQAKYFITRIAGDSPQDGYNILTELNYLNVKFFSTLVGNALAHSPLPKLFPVFADAMLLKVAEDNTKLAREVNERIHYYIGENTALTPEEKGKELDRFNARKKEITQRWQVKREEKKKEKTSQP